MENKRSKPCYECYEGICEEVIEDFALDPDNLSEPIVPSVKLLKCDKCGACSFPPSSCEYMDEYLEKIKNEE